MPKLNLNSATTIPNQETGHEAILVQVETFVTDFKLSGVVQFESAMSGYPELTENELDVKIAKYEKKFGISSEALLDMEAEGNLPDKFEFRAWLSWLRARGN